MHAVHSLDFFVNLKHQSTEISNK